MSRSSMFTASSAVTASGVMVIRDALSRTSSWPSAGLPATSLEANGALATKEVAGKPADGQNLVLLTASLITITPLAVTAGRGRQHR